MHAALSQSGQFNPMRGAGGQGGLHQGGGQHGMMASLHSGHPAQMMSYQGLQGAAHLLPSQQMQSLQQQLQQQSIQLQNSNTTGSQSFVGSELSAPELQQGPVGNANMPIHTLLPQETQILPSSVSQAMPSTQFLTPPSQHSYSGPMDTLTLTQTDTHQIGRAHV